MMLQFTLPPELEDRLRREADRQGLPPHAVVLKLLESHLPPADPATALSAADRRAATIAMLQQWAAEDEAMTEEEAASNAAVLRAIDEDRLSDRKLFEAILPPADRAAALRALFEQWRAEDESAPAGDPDYDFFQALDAARTSNRKLFPSELKGISW